MAVIALLAAALLQCPDGTPPPCASARTVSAAVPAGSIAVFPFTNRSPDSSDAYLAEALPEQIIGRLARVAALRVKSATAVNSQWRRTPDPMASARALRVEWFVTGSIRRSGGQLAVSAELVRVSTGDGAWSAPFRRRDGDVAAVEEQIAESVAVAIVGRLAPAQARALRTTPSRNPEAYRLYLYGRTRLARRTAADIHAALQAFEEAARLDPAFAGAWARIAQTRTLQRQYGGPDGLSVDSLAALGRAALGRAQRLDSTLAEAWLTGGLIAMLDGELGAAHAALERAHTLDSLAFETYHSLGYLYGVDNLDLPEVAAPLFRRALALNPDFRNAWRHLALSRRDEGRLAEAEALLDTSLSFGEWSLGAAERAFVRFARGNGVGALADLDRMTERAATLGAFGDTAIARRAYRLRLGDSASARRLLNQAGQAAPGDQDLVAIALLEAMLGAPQRAFDALEQLRTTPDTAEPRCGAAPCSTSLRTWRALHNPLFLPLRGDPRYQRLMADTRPRVPWLP